MIPYTKISRISVCVCVFFLCQGGGVLFEKQLIHTVAVPSWVFLERCHEMCGHWDSSFKWRWWQYQKRSLAFNRHWAEARIKNVWKISWNLKIYIYSNIHDITDIHTWILIYGWNVHISDISRFVPNDAIMESEDSSHWDFLRKVSSIMVINGTLWWGVHLNRSRKLTMWDWAAPGYDFELHWQNSSLYLGFGFLGEMECSWENEMKIVWEMWHVTIEPSFTGFILSLCHHSCCFFLFFEALDSSGDCYCQRASWRDQPKKSAQNSFRFIQLMCLLLAFGWFFHGFSFFFKFSTANWGEGRETEQSQETWEDLSQSIW